MKVPCPPPWDDELLEKLYRSVLIAGNREGWIEQSIITRLKFVCLGVILGCIQVLLVLWRCMSS